MRISDWSSDVCSSDLVNLLAVRREGIQPASDAIIESRAQAQDQIGAIHRHIGFIRAMHAQHSQPLRRGSRASAKAHQRAVDWSAGQFGQFATQPAGFWPAFDYATACYADQPPPL